jgi:hypothetical protein
MIYKSSWNRKGNRATFKDLFGCSVIVFEVCSGFWFPPFDPPPPPPFLYFGGSHLAHFFIFFKTIQLSVGEKIVGLQFLLGHEIERSTL